MEIFDLELECNEKSTAIEDEKNVSQDEITFNFGATFIPDQYYSDFMKWLLQDFSCEVRFVPETGRYLVRAHDRRTIANIFIYGTKRMSAVQIISKTLNGEAIEVKDFCGTSKNGSYLYQVNKTESLLAQERQQKILKAFTQWIDENDYRSVLKDLYNSTFKNYLPKRYDGSHLKFSGLSSDVTLYDYQKNAIARILEDENVLLSHKVGSGKTYELCVSAHELVTGNICKKVLITVPNNVLTPFVDTYHQLYPEDHDGTLVVITPKDFTPQKRDAAIKTIKGKCSIVIMAFSVFDRLKVSPEFHIRIYEDKIKMLRKRIDEETDIFVKANLKKEEKKVTKKLSEMKKENVEAGEIYFESFGFDAIMVDEAHHYKNISLPGCRADFSYNSLRSKGAKKSDQLLGKVRYIQKIRGHVVFATGTLFSNSISEIFVYQTYLQPNTLRFLNFEHLSSWVNTFCQTENMVEIDVDSKSFKTRKRFSQFNNLNELKSIFGIVCDFYHLDSNDGELPEFSGYQDVVVERSQHQAHYIESLGERCEAVKSGLVDKTQDNYLKICVDAMQVSLDEKLVMDLQRCSNNHGKIRYCSDKIIELDKEYPGNLQLVFCDMSTPKKGQFNIYDALKEVLILKGIACEKIAFVHDFETDGKKRTMIKRANASELSVLIGSTQKLGTGLNIQHRVIAAHHLDVPWRPCDFEQRNGRVLRPNNINEEVFIFRYVLKDSFDAYNYQILERKQHFISDFFSRESFISGVNQMRDLDDMVLNYAEIKALAMGNSIIKERIKTANLLSRKQIQSQKRQEDLRQFQETVLAYPDKIQDFNNRIAFLQDDMAHYDQHRTHLSKEERIHYGKALMKAVLSHLNQKCAVKADMKSYQGFKIILPAMMNLENVFVVLTNQGRIFHKVSFDLETFENGKNLGICQRIDNVLRDFQHQITYYQDRILHCTQERKMAEDELSKGNPYLDEIGPLTTQLKEIDEEIEQMSKE